MGKRYVIIQENVPRWYALSWVAEDPAIILSIHSAWIAQQNITEISERALDLQQELQLPKFETNFKRKIGFGGVFKNVGEKNDFIHFSVKIPRVETKTDEPCMSCEGTGKEKYVSRRKCLSCNGTGKEYSINWIKSHTISASFTILFAFLNYNPCKTSSKSFQLMEITTITRSGMHGGSLCGQISIPLYDWLYSLTKTQDELPEMQKATEIAYCRMFRRLGKLNIGRYRTKLEKCGGFTADCPGDATGIFPDRWESLESGTGFEFDCHNVDNSVQQISLLSALAALHDKAVAEIG